MGSAGNQLRRTSRERATQAYIWMGGVVHRGCLCRGSGTAAQDVENVPVIRVDARQYSFQRESGTGSSIWNMKQCILQLTIFVSLRMEENNNKRCNADTARDGLTADNKGHQHSVALTRWESGRIWTMWQG